jgi:hypothetical protein
MKPAGAGKNASAVSRLNGIGTELANLSIDQLCHIADLEVTTRIQNLGLQSLRPGATRRRRKRRGYGARVFALARLRNDPSRKIHLGKNAACVRVVAEKIPAMRLKSS